MDLEKELIILLDKYIREYEQMKEIYNENRTKQTLYEELIKVFMDDSINENKLSISILLNTIYRDDIYVDEFYRILYKEDNVNEMNNFIEKIKIDYINLKHDNRILKLRIDRVYEMYLSAKRVRACLKYQTPILKSKNDIFNIKRILSNYETSGIISNKEELLLINEIELHNRKIDTQRRNSPLEEDYVKRLYNEIPNILNIGFEEHDVIEVSSDRKPSLDKFVIEIVNLVDQIDISEVNTLLEGYEKYNLSNNEYDYIIVSVMDKYLEELLTLYELLVDKDVYKYRTERIDVINNYYQTLEKYIVVRNYYNKITECFIDEIVDDFIVEDDNEEKRLIYSRSNVNVTKAKIISDMSDVPYEYYETVLDLLDRFKNGTLGVKELKILTSHRRFRGHIELKYDQVRIIIKHIKGDIYNVFGVFVKKDDNDIPMYRIMTSRLIPDISTNDLLSSQLELSKKTEEELKTMVDVKSRKGTR